MILAGEMTHFRQSNLQWVSKVLKCSLGSVQLTLGNTHELSGQSNGARSLTHSILINLFIKIELKNFHRTFHTKYCVCPRVFSRLKPVGNLVPRISHLTAWAVR